ILPRSHELGGMQSIVYDEPLARYFLITFGDTFTDDARLIVFDAPAPEGPWSHCGSIGRAEAMPWLEADQTSIYNPSFNAKWIEPDGSMWISYASCCEPQQYTFTYGKISIHAR